MNKANWTRPLLWLTAVTAVGMLNANAFAKEAEHEQILHKEQTIALNAAEPLANSLHVAYKQRGKNYKPRTEHWMENGEPAFINRLILEDSPYLLQHAHNPINWYAWGEEAFKAALEHDKPIFLSIGYATCHWCHVMERESFENVDIATQLNDNFIAIKVDREQRPDVDASYMSAVTIMTGRGGWPMSSFLNHDSETFYGGTYYPPDVFSDLLNQISELWQKDRESLNVHAGEISAAVVANSQLAGEASEIGSNVVERAVADIVSSFDYMFGGFGVAPKFPQESKLFLLLDQAKRTGNPDVLEPATFSLGRMAAGGIHDHVAGGFHRYAVDDDWLVPHFEKMLYNQALLSRNYLTAFQITDDPEFKRITERTLDYVMREMTHPDGGFYSATDADSAGSEGTFFVWTQEELKAVLGEKDAAFANELWNLSATGNFEHSNILHHTGTLFEEAFERDGDVNALMSKLDDMTARLLEARQQREKPLRDDKIISAWNGMMISAFAEAGDVLARPDYLAAAVRAGEFIWQHNRSENALLLRAFFDGSASVASSQEDYAYLAEGYLALYDQTNNAEWLQRAEALVNTMHNTFWDTEQGGYFIGTEKVGAVRPKDLYDTSIPTGNAVALRTLVRLWRRTGKDVYKQRADALLIAFSSQLQVYPSAFSYMMTATNELLLGEATHLQYAARGNVKVSAAHNADNIVVELDIKPGWHVNAHKPNQDYLIPTAVVGTDGKVLKGATYPDAVVKKLGFSETELVLYEDKVALTVPASLTEAQTELALSDIILQLQACDDTVCLPPEDVKLRLSSAN